MEITVFNLMRGNVHPHTMQTTCKLFHKKHNISLRFVPWDVANLVCPGAKRVVLYDGISFVPQSEVIRFGQEMQAGLILIGEGGFTLHTHLEVPNIQIATISVQHLIQGIERITGLA